jgi:hypothetical protein
MDEKQITSSMLQKVVCYEKYRDLSVRFAFPLIVVLNLPGEVDGEPMTKLRLHRNIFQCCWNVLHKRLVLCMPSFTFNGKN